MMKDKTFKFEIDATLELYDEIVCDEELETIGNSFFERSYFGTRILILAPHFGDEIILAGNMILNLAAARAEIFAAYSAGDKAMAERNAAALKILGVPKDKIIYLEGELAGALKRLLLNLRANIIFCVDFDSNVDHKNLSAAFEKVLGEILRERPDYRPEIYKKLTYATALNSPPDFYAPNLLSVRKPKIGATDGYDFDLIDRANYSWAERVRFPVPESCRKTLLKNNPLAAAIFAYRQNHWAALRILNSDEIFFERRTDNQAFTAKVTATSGEPSGACDFKILDEIWRPAIDDAAKILAFDWEESVQLRRLVIYGNIFDEAAARLKIRLEIDNAGFSLDNVYEIDAALPKRGRPLILDTQKIFVRRAEIRLVEGGRDFGIGEVEFFANAEPLRKIAPFIKLTVDKDFFYRCDVPYEAEKISLGLYRFHVEEPVKITARANDENILTEVLRDGGELILNLGAAEEIALTAEVIGNPNIFDKAVIRRVGDWAQIQLKIGQWLDKMRVHKIRVAKSSGVK